MNANHTRVASAPSGRAPRHEWAQPVVPACTDGGSGRLATPPEHAFLPSVPTDGRWARSTVVPTTREGPAGAQPDPEGRVAIVTTHSSLISFQAT